MSGMLLNIRNLHVAYGDIPAIAAFDLTLDAGECVAILGPNGAGKSSLLRGLCGLAPAQGRIEFAGRDISALAAERRARLGLSYVPEGRRIFPGMTVRENLEVASFEPRKKRDEECARIFTMFPQLAARAGDTAWQLSGGQQQMLAIGRALMSRPRLILMDEPSLGLAPAITENLVTTIAQICAGGAAVILAEQNTALAVSSARHAIVLDRGKVDFRGDIAALKNQQTGFGAPSPAGPA